MTDEITEPGWYFYLSEYPDEGSDGPYPTEQACILAAHAACNDAYGEGEHVEFVVWEKR